MDAGPAQMLATQRNNPINPICNDLINIDEFNILVTNSYRKKEEKFQNNLLNEGKRSFRERTVAVALCEARAHGPQVRGYRLEALLQCEHPRYGV
jgi:hypothetical protein